ncbi:MAG: DoxX family protein [Pseudodesulfovibrio sp.]
MKKYLASKPLYLVLRVILGGLFIYAGYLKLADVGAFAQAIDGYGLVTWSTAKLLSKTLPVLEILAGLGLILDIKGALGTIVALLLGFMILIGYAIYMGLDVDCGCFGPSDSVAGDSSGLWQTLYRDVAMFAGCLLLYWQRAASCFAVRRLISLNFLKKGE